MDHAVDLPCCLPVSPSVKTSKLADKDLPYEMDQSSFSALIFGVSAVSPSVLNICCLGSSQGPFLALLSYYPTWHPTMSMWLPCLTLYTSVVPLLPEIHSS